MGVIAMSETTGSLGHEIGQALGRALGWAFHDREILARAAEEFGDSLLELAHVTEERPTLWERLADSKRRYLAAVEAVLFELAARDNVILSGRGSTVLLARVPHVLRVRVTAPDRVRARRVEQQQGLTAEAAQDLVAQTDHERAARIRYLYHVDWADPLRYDLVLNTERLTVERAVAAVQETLRDPRFLPTAESLQLAADLSLEAHARAALLGGERTQRLRLQVAVKEGLLTVSGVVEEESERKAAEEVLRAVPGVTALTNEISVLRAVRLPGGRL